MCKKINNLQNSTKKKNRKNNKIILICEILINGLQTAQIFRPMMKFYVFYLSQNNVILNFYI